MRAGPASRALRVAGVVVLLAVGASCSDDGSSDATTPTGLTAIGGAAEVGSTTTVAGGTSGASDGTGAGGAGAGTTGGASGGSSTTTTGGAGAGTATTVAGSTASGGPTSVATTLAPSTTAATTSTVAPSTTIAPTTVPAVETLPPTTAPPASGPCDLATVVAQTETDFDGITPSDLRCAGTWAAWVGAADDPATSDSFFAVATWDGDAWVLANLGTASVCTDAGVPASLWPSLGCTE